MTKETFDLIQDDKRIRALLNDFYRSQGYRVKSLDPPGDVKKDTIRLVRVTDNDIKGPDK